jgi:glycosyltransferase involved in cell wall biosynthesis
MVGISVIVPCRNEVGYIDSFLESLYAQQFDRAEYSLEVLVADGRSDDGTLTRLEEWRSRDASLVIIDNPGRIVSTGLNAAIERASGTIIIRMDVHTTYEPDYIARCAQALLATGAACVGGPWRAVGKTPRQHSIADAFMNRFGSGGALSRNIDYTGAVDTVYLGCWHRDTLIEAGGFDGALVRNQDDELNLRLKRAGGVVWQDAAIRSYYVPRDSYGALFRQFSQYGYWKVPVIRKHRLPASPRQLAPFLFVAALAVLAVASMFAPLARWMLAALAVAYALGIAATSGLVTRPRHGLRVAAAMACMHFGYGSGFGRGLLDFVLLRRGPALRATQLTR